MNLTPYWKSVLEQEESAIVLCNLQHEIIYMNPEAIKRYHKRGGAALIGKNLLDCHNACSNTRIRQVTAWFAESPTHNRLFTFHNEKENKDVYMIALRDEHGTLIGYYEKHEYRNRETKQPYSFSESV
jgi:PAS domain-containing protein